MRKDRILGLEYPDHTSIESTLHFYADLSKISIEKLYKMEDIPEGVVLQEKSLRKLLLFGHPGELLIKLFDYFPFARYSYIGCTDDYSSKLLSEANDILIIDGDAESVQSLIKKGVSEIKIIVPHFEKDSKLRGQSVMVFNRGSGRIDAEDCKNLIVVDQKTTGLMGFLNSVSGISRALPEKTVYVDCANYETPYLPAAFLGTVNPWDCWFKQPSNVNISEIYDNESYMTWIFTSIDVPALYDRTILKERILKKEQQLLETLQVDVENGVAIFFRGSDYYFYPRHPHPLETDELLSLVGKGLSVTYNSVLLVTEDEPAYNALKNEFGEKIKAIDRKRYPRVEIPNPSNRVGF